MSHSLHENHWGSPTLTLLNVLGVLTVLHVLHVLHVLNMPMDASLACWALLWYNQFFLDHITCLYLMALVLVDSRILLRDHNRIGTCCRIGIQNC